MDREELELLGKLQVKAGRTVLRHSLIMAGNALLLGFVFAAVVVTAWFVVWQTGGAWFRSFACGLLGLEPAGLGRLMLAAIGLAKIEAIVLLLCPGLALRICGAALKP